MCLRGLAFDAQFTVEKLDVSSVLPLTAVGWESSNSVDLDTL